MQIGEPGGLAPTSADPLEPSVAPPVLQPPVLQPPVPRPIVQDRELLRLLVPEGVAKGSFGVLRQAPVIEQYAHNRGVVRRLDSLYYDTEDHLLFGLGMSLRVQRQGKRFIQTLRHLDTLQQEPGNISGETWQAPVADAAPDLSRLASIEALSPLLERLVGVPMVVVFETRLRRQVRRLQLPTALLDVAFDEGMIEAGAEQQAVREITLSLQSGEASVMYDVGMRLLELAPVQVSSAGIAARGYALASGVAIKAEKAAPSALTPALAVDDMIAAVLAGCQAHLQANQEVARAGRNPDGVHQMRVALRRLRSAFSLLHRELPSATLRSLGTEAKWAAGELETARSWDVFLTTTLAGPSHLQRAGSDFDGLRNTSEQPRAAGYAAVQALLDASRYGRFQLALGHWIARRGWRNEVDSDGLAVLAEPAPAMAMRVLARLQRRVHKQGAQFRKLSATERHELRITLKKLRYATEFFLPLFGQAAHGSRYIRRLSRLQDALGLDHDAATTQPLLDEIGQLSRSPGVHQAIGIVIGWQGREGLAAGEMLTERWQRFRTLPPFWITA
jgi:inorganic triphosphatase YgiF